jgi:hypothetical protein
MGFQELGCDGMDWIDVVQNRNICRAFVNTVMNPTFHKVRGISCPAEGRLTFQGPCSMHLVHNIKVIDISHIIHLCHTSL